MQYPLGETYDGCLKNEPKQPNLKTTEGRLMLLLNS